MVGGLALVMQKKLPKVKMKIEKSTLTLYSGSTPFIRVNLEILNDVQGHAFPKPNHLSTPGAETRLLDFNREIGLEKVELTDEEKSTPLKYNKVYKKRYDKVKLKTASLLEALYVQECQYERTDAAQEFVINYVSDLRKNI